MKLSAACLVVIFAASVTCMIHCPRCSYSFRERLPLLRSKLLLKDGLRDYGYEEAGRLIDYGRYPRCSDRFAERIRLEPRINLHGHCDGLHGHRYQRGLKYYPLWN